MILFVPLNQFTYICPNGHDPTSTRPLAKCPAYKCNGKLERYGKGSRGPYQTKGK